MDILIVEDDKNLSDMLMKSAMRQGYGAHAIYDGKEALSYMKEHTFSLLILDLSLPNADGMEICHFARSRSAVPIIILSARGGEEDKIAALEIGADDYITKPYSEKEVFARIRSLLRRSRMSPIRSCIRDGGLIVDKEARKATYLGQTLCLSAKEFDLLTVLCENKGRMMSKDYLLDTVWGSDCFSEPSTLTVHINKLREKLEIDPKHPKKIITVWGSGYRYDGE